MAEYTYSALERIEAGAQVVQVVSDICSTWGRVAHSTNKGILARMERDGVDSVQEYIGIAA